MPFKIYEATRENGQCADEHLGFFSSLLENGNLRANYDVVVRGGWADGPLTRERSVKCSKTFPRISMESQSPCFLLGTRL